jgi:hypothetical protein
MLSDIAPADRSAHHVLDESGAHAFRNLDWSEYESHFGPPRKSLVDFYKHTDLVLSRRFAFKAAGDTGPRFWEIEAFIPPSRAFDSVYAESLPVGSLLIATDGMGNSYFVQLRKWTAEDGPVLFYDHETGEISETGLLLSALGHAPRVVVS